MIDVEGEQVNKLQQVYEHKKEKYTDLKEECQKVFEREVILVPIIVSSLGAISKQSIKGLKKMLKIGTRDKGYLDTILRRMSIISCICSYFIFNDLQFKTLNGSGKSGQDKAGHTTKNNGDASQDSEEEMVTFNEDPNFETVNTENGEDKKEQNIQDNATQETTGHNTADETSDEEESNREEAGEGTPNEQESQYH